MDYMSDRVFDGKRPISAERADALRQLINPIISYATIEMACEIAFIDWECGSERRKRIAHKRMRAALQAAWYQIARDNEYMAGRNEGGK